jgi:V/A-type H+-transporting ATPase subunit E|tara:strand:- start:6204 stop:6761 length:558 start_codon:yes stop_codon:yes gene_type:complete
MTLDALAAEIASQAEAEARSIIKEAQAEASRIEEEARKQASEAAEVVGTRAERESQQLSVEVVASARQANQKRALVAKRGELDTTWESVKEQVASPKLKGRKGILDSLLKEAGKSSSDVIMRPVSTDRASLVKSGFKMGDDIEGLGGFVIESKDGTTVLDYRFDYLLEAAWKGSLGEVNRILFGE